MLPKIIEHYWIAEFVSVQKRSDMDNEEWKWREKYIGIQGELFIMQSLKKFPGKCYLYFTDRRTAWMTTGYGEPEINGAEVTIVTRNSRYQFKILYDEEV